MGELIDYTIERPFTDLELECQDGKLYFSKFLLSSVSPYFSSMLNGNFKEGSSKTITLPFSTKLINFFLNTLIESHHNLIKYYGDHVFELVELSELFLMPKLKDLCDHYLASHFTNYTSTLLLFADRYQLLHLRTKLIIFYLNRTSILLSSEEFPQLSFDFIISFNFPILFKIAYEWFKHGDNKKYIVQFMVHIRDNNQLQLCNIPTIYPIVSMIEDKDVKMNHMMELMEFMIYDRFNPSDMIKESSYWKV